MLSAHLFCDPIDWGPDRLASQIAIARHGSDAGSADADGVRSACYQPMSLATSALAASTSSLEALTGLPVLNVGLGFETGQQIHQGLLLGWMDDRNGVQIRMHEPVKEHDRVGAPELDRHTWQGCIHSGIVTGTSHISRV